MANLSRTITVRTDSTPGASVDCSLLDAVDRTFVYVGTDGDAVRVEGSNDDSNYVEVFTARGASWRRVETDRCLYYRTVRLDGDTSASLKVSGAEITTQAGPAGAPSMGDKAISGTCSTTDATATVVASFTPAEDGGYSVMGHLVGVKDDETVYSTGLIATWKRVSGTLTAIGVQKFGEQTGSLDPGDPTAVAASGVAQIKVTGIVATNINWSFNGARASVAAF